MRKYSAIILAGGESSRMGRKKATLLIHDKTFIDFQIHKLRSIGIDEIIISGYYYSSEKCVCVEDIYTNKGPLAGIHAGLVNLKNESALVLTEDAPLVPVDFLKQLIKEHDINASSITVTTTDGRIQPLLGIYDKKLASRCDDILKCERATVMSLIEQTGFAEVPFEGDEVYIRGCNTPEEYIKIIDLSYK